MAQVAPYKVIVYNNKSMSGGHLEHHNLLVAAEARHTELASYADSLLPAALDAFGPPENFYPKLYEPIDALSNGELEALYYVGLRPLVVGLAEKLRDESIKQSAIDSASQSMVEGWDSASRKASSSGLAISDLRAARDPLRDIARDVYDRLPIAGRVVTDMATMTVDLRRYRPPIQFGLLEEDINRPLSPATSFQMMRYQQHRPSADRVGDNGLVASNLVLRSVLQDLHRQRYPDQIATPRAPDQDGSQEIPSTERQFMRIADTIGPTALRALTLDYVGRRAAAVIRFDGVRAGEVSRLVGVNSEGDPIFKNDQRVPRSQLGQPATDRLVPDIFRCPAVFSELIPITLDIVKQAAVQAEERAQKVRTAELPYHVRALRLIRRPNTVWVRDA